MKKNRMMRLASILLVCVLLTTSVISGTFAKYTTSDTGTDTARVAKWGVSATINGGAFATQYEKNSITSIDYTVVTNPTGDGKQLVAPGTSGTFAGVKLTGAPEVAVEITHTADLVLSGWEIDLTDDGVDNPTFYCPLVFTVNGSEIKQDATNDTAAKLEAAVEAAITAGNGEYEANTNLSTIASLNGDFGWSWAFGDPANNDSDTALGNLGTAPEVSLAVTTLVEQID